ncbi:MAG: ATP-binding cassette domain-containing protein [Nitrososphaerales archaeon]
MIELKAKKRLGKFLFDSELKDESFICLVGKNGSGKTSLLNIIAGVYRPDEGYVKINSETVTDVSAEKKQIVLVTPDSCIPNFQVDKHLVWGAKLRKKHVENDAVMEIRKKLGIDYNGKVSKLSLGMKERVSLATALLASPKVILIDEAFGNIDNRIEFINTYRELTHRAMIDVIFSTQHAEDSKVADHLYEMDQGRATRVF